MSDFSIFALFTAGLACMAPFASAYTKPTGSAPKGNPISEPGLNSLVPAGKSFTVTWQPTTKGTVTLVLLKGPSSDAEPQYAIAEKIPNDGTFVWTPSKDLAPSPDGDATGYGIQLIDDATGQYQYTTQFGISNPGYKPGSDKTSPSSSSSSKGWGRPTSSGKKTGSATSTVTSKAVVPTGTAASSGWAPHNITMVSPTGALTVPSSLMTSASSAVGASSAAAATSTGSRTGSNASSTRTPQVNAASAGASGAFGAISFVVAAGVAAFFAL